MDEKQEILDLRRELEQANYEYYVLDDPSMSDYDFDHKLRRLEELEAKYPELVTPDSPTQRVGGKVADGFTEVHHRVPLESLQDGTGRLRPAGAGRPRRWRGVRRGAQGGRPVGGAGV